MNISVHCGGRNTISIKDDKGLVISSISFNISSGSFSSVINGSYSSYNISAISCIRT